MRGQLSIIEEEGIVTWEGCVELIGEEIVFEALNNTKLALPQSEILERSEVRLSEP